MCAGNGAECYIPPDQSVDVGSTTQASFNIDPDHRPVGILIYKLKRKNEDQSNEEVISNEEETACIYFFIIWKVYSS
jgi:hypothetical protein